MNAPALMTREAVSADVPKLCQLLNDIIATGGTTAFETPLSQSDFAWLYLEAPAVISCVVAVPGDGSDNVPVGFQSITSNAKLPDHWGDVATFCQQGLQGTGVGTLLFQHTCRLAREHQLVTLNATIRADNTGGLAYYTKQGFTDYSVNAAVPLKDGTPVDRISKQYVLASVESGHQERS